MYSANQNGGKNYSATLWKHSIYAKVILYDRLHSYTASIRNG